MSHGACWTTVTETTLIGGTELDSVLGVDMAEATFFTHIAIPLAVPGQTFGS